MYMYMYLCSVVLFGKSETKNELFFGCPSIHSHVEFWSEKATEVLEVNE